MSKETVIKYVAPAISVVELNPESILCASAPKSMIQTLSASNTPLVDAILVDSYHDADVM